MDIQILNLRHRRLAAPLIMAAFLAACGGGGGGGSSNSSISGGGTGVTPPPVVVPAPVRASTQMTDTDTVKNFLMRASWGGSETQIDDLTGTNAADWLRAQMSAPPTDIVGTLRTEVSDRSNSKQGHRKIWWDEALSGNADLRSRMVFALSQILVASTGPGNSSVAARDRTAAYLDTLSEHAFGNYRDLLEAITYTPQMGVFLTYRGNRPESNDGSRQPDENYAREIMQLFSIGLTELNPDGTQKTGADGQPIETYTNADVQGLSRVFTGISFRDEGQGFRANPESDVQFGPMEIWPAHHSRREKVFLGTSIAAGTPGEETVSMALDTIFAHPNVAPFVSKRLIQRFTASSPSPDYVARVSAAFDAGRYTTAEGESFGTGERGDLAATLAAVLLDPQFFDDVAPGPRDGKIREPILRWAHWAKAAQVEVLEGSNEWHVFDNMAGSSRGLSQGIAQSPSVFSFYRSGYRAQGSASAQAGLTAPELQLVNEAALRGYYDFMFDFVVDATARVDSTRNTFKATYPALRALADDPAAMVDWTQTVLISGEFEPTTRQRMIDAISLSPLRDGRFDAELGLDKDRLSRAKIAVYMAVTSHEYGMQY